MSGLNQASPLTTILYDPKEGGFYLLDRHYNRLLSATAAVFPELDRRPSQEGFNERIWEQVGVLGLDVRQRLRVTIDRDLRFHATSMPFPKTNVTRLALRLDTVPTKATEHKTTARDVYEQARLRVNADYMSSDATATSPFDVLMWNEKDELTETSIANFAVYLRGSDLALAVPGANSPPEREEGIFVTPSLEKGLVSGVMRAELLERGTIVEGTITRSDIYRFAKDLVAYPMICFNAIRGIYDVYLIDELSNTGSPERPSYFLTDKSSETYLSTRHLPLPELKLSSPSQSEFTTPNSTPILTPAVSSRPSSSSSFYKDYSHTVTLPSPTSHPIPSTCPPFVWRRGVIIDCYDSYTNNLLQLFDQKVDSLGGSPDFDATLAAHITVLRADQISWPDFRSQVLPHLDFVILSPGPGSPHVPADIGVGGDLLLAMTSGQLETRLVPILGVCLGHQALAALLGGRVTRARELVHGRTVPIQHTGTGLFDGLDSRHHLHMVRYNSLTVDPATLPADLEVIAVNPDDGEIMGLQHKKLPLYSVQFHPESICSRRSNCEIDYGKHILRNFMNMVDKFWVTQGQAERFPLPVDIQHLGVLNLAELGVVKPKLPGKTVESDARGNAYRIERRDIGSFIPQFSQFRQDLVFESTSYSPDQPFFWLDSAAAAPGDQFARFSYMGPASIDRCISYNLSTNMISCGRGASIRLEDHDTFWHWMDRVQCDWTSRVNTGDSAEGFKCGFVGYFGYEMKTGALPGYRAPTESESTDQIPDAQFMFVDRLIAYDHWNKTWTALGLVFDESVELDQCLLFKDTGITAGMTIAQFEDWIDSLKQKIQSLRKSEATAHPLGDDPLPFSFTYNSTPEAYKSAINDCKTRIAEGNSYELCLTGQYTATIADTKPDYLAVYKHFRTQNPASHAAFLSFPASETTIMSCSPELFIRFDGVSGRQAIMKPIKGTLKRSKCRCGGLCKLPACGARKAECDSARYKLDEQRIQAFVSDPKETAENLMIADLIRANLLEFCSPSSVDVTKLFALETYENVYSLVSTITGTLLPSIGTVEGIRRCFPPGSMTGAPKLRSVQLLDELETSSRRGIYSGCLGFLSLDNRAVFSVVIRTLIAHQRQLSYGAGGAITWLSEVDGEWDEVVLKARSVLKERVSKSS